MINEALLEFIDMPLDARMRLLKKMDKSISKYGDEFARGTIWHDWGAGLRATAEESIAHRQAIAEDDTKFINAMYCYCICMNSELNAIINGE